MPYNLTFEPKSCPTDLRHLWLPYITACKLHLYVIPVFTDCWVPLYFCPSCKSHTFFQAHCLTFKYMRRYMVVCCFIKLHEHYSAKIWRTFVHYTEGLGILHSCAKFGGNQMSGVGEESEGCSNHWQHPLPLHRCHWQDSTLVTMYPEKQIYYSPLQRKQAH